MPETPTSYATFNRGTSRSRNDSYSYAEQNIGVSNGGRLKSVTVAKTVPKFRFRSKPITTTTTTTKAPAKPMRNEPKQKIKEEVEYWPPKTPSPIQSGINENKDVGKIVEKKPKTTFTVNENKDVTKIVEKKPKTTFAVKEVTEKSFEPPVDLQSIFKTPTPKPVTVTLRNMNPGPIVFPEETMNTEPVDNGVVTIAKIKQANSTKSVQTYNATISIDEIYVYSPENNTFVLRKLNNDSKIQIQQNSTNFTNATIDDPQEENFAKLEYALALRNVSMIKTIAANLTENTDVVNVPKIGLGVVTKGKYLAPILRGYMKFNKNNL